ncbi:MAG: hypothetical protein JXA37_00655 [Chloroflexia bacterium]|nr:hypothetical protein [Chloroflexia bacterium]
MEQQSLTHTALILENRHTIASILAELLQEAGYPTFIFSELALLHENLPRYLPAVLLADLGMLQEHPDPLWPEVLQAIESLDIPILYFACSTIADAGENVLLLRSPGDFAAIVDKLERELLQKRPALGITLINMGQLEPTALDVALRLQKDLALLGRRHSLGDLLVRLDLISTDTLEKALQEQEA